MKDKLYLKTKDFALSGEEFSLYYDEEHDMLITKPVPDTKALSAYYKSDNYISHTDAKRNLMEWIYAIVKKYMLGKKISLVEQFSEKGNLLDIGAGTGAFLEVANKNGWNVLAVEPNENAKAFIEKKNIKVCSDIFNLQSKKFNVITMWHVLEHMPNLQKTIQQLNSLLEHNGYLFIAVPNYKSFDAAYYKSYWAAYDVPRHLWHFSQNSIKKLFADTSLNVVKTLPMYFDAYYVSLLSEQYKKNKRPWFKAMYVGYQSNKKAKRTGEYSSLLYVLKKS